MNVKVKIRHSDGYEYEMVVHELIDAMALDRSMYPSDKPATYTIVENTSDEVTHRLCNDLNLKMLQAVGGNYVPYFEKIWRSF